MSTFVKQALAEKLTRDVREVESLGYTVQILGGLVLIEATGAVAALPTPATVIAELDKLEARKKRKAVGRKPKAVTPKDTAAAAGSATAGALCRIETRRGVCGGTINRNGNCPKCAQRAYAAANYAKTHSKKA